MNRMNLVKILPFLAMLTACGGGGNSSAAPAPTPVPSSSASSSTGTGSSTGSSSTGTGSSTGSSSTGTGSSTASSTGGAIPTPVVTGPVNVPFWTTFGQKNGEAIQAKANEFRAIMAGLGYDVTIDCSYQGAYDDVHNKIINGFSAGNIPTMAIAYPDHVADYLANEPNPYEYVYSLDRYMDDPNIGFGKQSYLGDTDGKDDFVEAFIDEGTHYQRVGETCSIPLMKSSEVMFYNVNAVARALKIMIPDKAWGADSVQEYLTNASWSDLADLSRVALQNKATVLSTLEIPIYYDSDSNFFISKMYQNEIAYSSIGQDGRGVIDFESGDNRARAEAMVREFQGLAAEGLLTTKGVKNQYGSDWFKSGRTLFEIGSSGGTGYNNPEGGSFKVGVSRVPASNDNPLYISQGPTMTFLKNPSITDEQNDTRMWFAWQFAKYLTNSHNNVFLCIYGSEGYLPVRYSAYDTEEFADQFLKDGEIYAQSAKVLIDDIDGRYINTAVFKGSAELRDQCEGIVKQALNGGNVTQLFNDAIREAKGKF